MSKIQKPDDSWMDIPQEQKIWVVYYLHGVTLYIDQPLYFKYTEHNINGVSIAVSTVSVITAEGTIYELEREWVAVEKRSGKEKMCYDDSVEIEEETT